MTHIRAVIFIVCVVASALICAPKAEAGVFKKICDMIISDYPFPFEHLEDDVLVNHLERLRIRVHFGYQTMEEHREHDELVRELERRRRILDL